VNPKNQLSMPENLVTLEIKKMFLPEKQKTFKENGIPFANWEQFLKDNLQQVEMNLHTEKKDTRLYLLEMTFLDKQEMSLKMLMVMVKKILREKRKKFHTPCLDCLNLLLAEMKEGDNFCYLLYDVMLKWDHEEFFYYFQKHNHAKPSLRRMLAEHPLCFWPGEKITLIACK
jgi:hypothetical protein